MATQYHTLDMNEDADRESPRICASDIDVPSNAKNGVMRRLGYLPCLLLISSALGSLVFVACISFLWFANDDNILWNYIAIAGWTARTIAIAAVVLRTSITVQAGIASSMLASILLEDAGIYMPKLAVLSIMRAAAPAPYTLFRHIWPVIYTKNWIFSSLAAALTITSVFLQFTSTVLLADLDTGYVTGNLVSYPVTIRQAPTIGTRKWNVGVREYPAFAEYSEGMAADGSSGLSDTGLTLRAFLPISRQENRSSIHKYEGFSQVFDTRVVCVRPNITNLEVYLNSSLPVLHGSMSIPSDLRELAAASRLYGKDGDEFNCQVSIGALSEYQRYMYHQSDWKMTVCQFYGGSGHIQEAFREFNASEEGHAFLQKSYLLVNFTGDLLSPLGDIPEYTANPHLGFASLGRLFNDSIPGLVRRNRADWVDLYRTNGNYTPTEIRTKLSFSLCFSGFPARPFNISASSSVPPVEPRYRYDSDSGRVNFDDVRKQMLTSSGSLEDRGVLSLASQNWSTNWDGFYSYFHWMDVDSLLSMEDAGGAPTIHLIDAMTPSFARADISMGGLLLDILRSNGTTAEAMQSMLMVALESRYQDYLFFVGRTATMDRSNYSSQRADFVPVQIPGGQRRTANHAAGATQSYVLIMSAVFIHSVIVCSITAWYLKATTATLLWESWSNIAQIINSDTIGYLEKASAAKDSEVKAWMQSENLHLTSIKVKASPKL
ncbi:hypothetical protein BS50DRAFT_622120 [Corynespora cassiicola Philippines]|uniref:Uncharacterized protein n=1 Tax=Corynespora cassiicola Philippines TaxID=1448308 RepID=A0A2T2NLZ9_CORCC|nr:hypothetical protein BS50DRAFT_622120 [Corynespora cassiicola Philippines]